jgi:hypothetical protein
MDRKGVLYGTLGLQNHRYYRLRARDRKPQINPLHPCPPSYAFPVYIWQLKMAEI